MYTGNLIYQAERPLSRAEQQQVDIANAELIRKVSRCWHALAAPLRALRSTGRAAGRPTRRQPGYLPHEYPAAERLTECQAGYQAGECLPGRAA
jgi:hypothetical protein